MLNTLISPVSWWRVELGVDYVVNKVSEIWFTMYFGVYVSTLHVWSCVFRFFSWRWFLWIAVMGNSRGLYWVFILSDKTRSSLTFHFGAIDGLIFVSLKRWTFPLSIFHVFHMFLFVDGYSYYYEVLFDVMADMFISRGSIFLIWSVWFHPFSFQFLY